MKYDQVGGSAAYGALSFDDVLDAEARLAKYVHRTPVITSETLDQRLSARIWLKCEQMQRTGSFKFRGAFNTVAQLTPKERSQGLCTVSSGNHAQALALAGSLHQTPVHVLMPQDAPSSKAASARFYGAKVDWFDRYATPQSVVAEGLIADKSMTYVSAHDDARICAGAGTAALELFEETGELDILVAPVGGGGGLAGYGVVARALCPGCRVVGVEPVASGVNRQSLIAGRRIVIPVPETIADGQTVTTPGAVNFEIMRHVVDSIELVNDEEIMSTIQLLFEQMKMVVEPSGASALAALLSGRLPCAGKRVGVVLSGGNVDVRLFCRCIERSIGDREGS